MEINVDGMVGPSHHYGGLSPGNLASGKSRQNVSNPRKAALQGLKKMEFWMKMGVPQYFLPPHFRPNVSLLKKYLELNGSTAKICELAYKKYPAIFSAACSSSFMWTANAATVIAAADSPLNKIQIFPANLETFLHRSQETPTTAKLINRLMGKTRFDIHPALPTGKGLSDEGAANHMRLCKNHGEAGINIFVYGKKSGGLRFPARQSQNSVKKISALTGLSPKAFFYFEQKADSINAGVFHNDVIATSHLSTLLVHEKAFENSAQCMLQLERAFEKTCKAPLHILKIKSREMSLSQAVASYFFNSQLAGLPSGQSLFLMPSECRSSPAVQRVLEKWEKSGIPFPKLRYINLRQSMKNGGGPACLRLRLPISTAEAKKLSPQFQITEVRLHWLKNWVERHYRDRLTLKDLTDPQMPGELKKAHLELSQYLKIPFNIFSP